MSLDLSTSSILFSTPPHLPSLEPQVEQSTQQSISSLAATTIIAPLERQLPVACDTYMSNKAPGRYGGQQADYMRWVECTIQEGVNILRNHPELDKPQLFFLLLQHIAKARHRIACEHQTQYSDLFGKFRYPDLQLTTPLGGRSYSEFNSIIRQYLQNFLNNAPQGDLAKGWKRRIEETYFNRRCVCELQLTDEDVVSEIDEYLDVMKDLYNIDVKSSSPANSQKTLLYLVARVQIEINHKWYDLSKYVTHTYTNATFSPKKGLDNARILLIHQDASLINDTLQEISILFAKAMEWTQEKPLDDLTHLVGLIQFLFAHSTPYARGSASIGERLGEILYGFHKLRCQYNSDTMIDLEALTAPLLYKFIENRYVFSLALFNSSSNAEECLFGTLPIGHIEAPELQPTESARWEDRNWAFYISDNEDSE